MPIPDGVVVLERGWLSANNVVFAKGGRTAVVDTGYATHEAQTIALIEQALGGSALATIVNTHLHSDHCGGNAALQRCFRDARTFIPPGQADSVRNWDPVALTYEPTGQFCPRFRIDGILRPGTTIVLGLHEWEIHAAPGHDPHSVILFEPLSRTLISADALWRHGFGVVFPELEGEHAFTEVGATLDLIESLAPATVIPGHGAVFTELDDALSIARRRLDSFIGDPRKHALHAAKVLIKFKLLELQRVELPQLTRWACGSTYFPIMHERFFSGIPLTAWPEQLVDELVRTGAAKREGSWISDA